MYSDKEVVLTLLIKNYIDGIDSKKYKEIYDSIILPKSILNLGEL